MKRRALFIIAILFAGALCHSVSFALSQQVSSGLTYLTTIQNFDGSWGNTPDSLDTDLYSTAAVIETLRTLGQTSESAHLNAVQWLNGYPIDNAGYLASKILASSGAGVDLSSDLITLIQWRYDNGGWGGVNEFTSNNFHTALALQALKAVNYPDQNVIYSAIGYLTSSQNPDGGWGFYPSTCSGCDDGDESNVYITATVLQTFNILRSTFDVQGSINSAAAYLLTKQNPDGGFGGDRASAVPASTVYETALAYLALMGATTDNTVLGKAINYLTSTQSPDGSWFQDPYSTALALRALYIAENGPPAPTSPPPVTLPGDPTGATTITMSGTVLDSVTGAPVAGAEVTVAGKNLIAKTDSSGGYVLAGIDVLVFNLKVSALGYDSKTYSVTTVSFGDYTLDASLDRSRPSDLGITAIETDYPSYKAYSDVVITGTFENNGTTLLQALVLSRLEDSSGKLTIISPPSPLMEFPSLSPQRISLSWNTGRFAPGDYRVIFQAIDPGTGSILAVAAAPFAIIPTVGISDPRILLSPQYSHQGANAAIVLPVALSNRSNVEATLFIEHDMREPGGAIINSGTTSYLLKPEDVTPGIILAEFTHTFGESGQYSVEARITDGATSLGTAANAIIVAPVIRIEPTKTLTPDTVVPDGDKRIRINIRLEGK